MTAPDVVTKTFNTNFRASSETSFVEMFPECVLSQITQSSRVAAAEESTV